MYASHCSAKHKLPTYIREALSNGQAFWLDFIMGITHFVTGKFCEGEGLTQPSGECAAGFYCQAGSTTPRQEAENWPEGSGKCPPGHYCPQGKVCPLKLPNFCSFFPTRMRPCLWCLSPTYDSPRSTLIAENTCICCIRRGHPKGARQEHIIRHGGLKVMISACLAQKESTAISGVSVHPKDLAAQVR